MTTLLATKADLSNTQLLLKQELVATRDSLKQEISEFHSALSQELCALRESVKKDLELFQSSMTIRWGTMLVVSMSLLLGALRLIIIR